MTSHLLEELLDVLSGRVRQGLLVVVLVVVQYVRSYFKLVWYTQIGVYMETYIMLLLMKEIPIMNIQLGTTAKAQKTYPSGTATPYLARGPSNGWK